MQGRERMFGLLKLSVWQRFYGKCDTVHVYPVIKLNMRVIILKEKTNLESDKGARYNLKAGYIE